MRSRLVCTVMRIMVLSGQCASSRRFCGNVKDLSTKGSRQVEWVIFPFLIIQAPSLELFKSELKAQTRSDSWVRFATAGLVWLLSAHVVQEVSYSECLFLFKNNDSVSAGRGLVDSGSIL